MKKIITFSLLFGALAANAQFSSTVFEKKSASNMAATKDEEPAYLGPGNPGNPDGLPINDYAYVLFAAGAALAAYAARKKRMAI